MLSAQVSLNQFTEPVTFSRDVSLIVQKENTRSPVDVPAIIAESSLTSKPAGSSDTMVEAEDHSPESLSLART